MAGHKPPQYLFIGKYAIANTYLLRFTSTSIHDYILRKISVAQHLITLGYWAIFRLTLFPRIRRPQNTYISVSAPDFYLKVGIVPRRIALYLCTKIKTADEKNN